MEIKRQIVESKLPPSNKETWWFDLNNEIIKRYKQGKWTPVLIQESNENKPTHAIVKYSTIDGSSVISDTAFMNLASEIVFPTTYIPYGAFNEKENLCQALIVDTTEIGNYAFCDCSSLESVIIPDSVTSIGNYAFDGCTSLNSITIPNSVTKIGEGAFSGCSSLTAFYGKFASADNRCLIVDGVLNSFAPDELTEYTIPNSVTSIGYAAFYGCTSLSSITIPNSVKEIGKKAFPKQKTYGLYAVYGKCVVENRYVILNNELIYIADTRDPSLEEESVIAIPSTVKKLGYQSLSFIMPYTESEGDEGLRYYGYIVHIPESVETISENAFYWTADGIIRFEGKFSSNDGHLLMEDPTTLTSVAACHLTDLDIPEGIIQIKQGACQGAHLNTLTIPTSTTSIGKWAFAGMDNYLQEAYIKAVTPPTAEQQIFGVNPAGLIIYVPEESVDAYKNATNWSEYRDQIVGYNF